MCGAGIECAAVVKADAYGMGMEKIAQLLRENGTKDFFVANSREGRKLRSHIGEGARIFILDGYSRDHSDDFVRAALVPCLADLNSLKLFLFDFRDQDYAVHIETGLNRLALDDMATASHLAEMHARQPALIMSHLACADDRKSPVNRIQLDRLRNCALARLFPGAPLSLAGTEGIFLGQDYRFDFVRPGIGLYCGGFGQTTSDSLGIDASLIAVKEINSGEGVGYGQTWVAPRRTKIAALSMGYADGLPRTEREFRFFANGTGCAVRGRVSMDIVNVDVTHLDTVPEKFELIGENQSLSQLSHSFGEIPNSILTRFGACMDRRIV